MESNTLHRGRLIDHILLVVEDFEASKNFYTAVLSALEIPVITTANEYLLADELVLVHPQHASQAAELVIVGGPWLFLLGCALFKWVMNERPLPPEVPDRYMVPTGKYPDRLNGKWDGLIFDPTI